MPAEERGPDLRQASKVTRPRGLAQGPATPLEKVRKLQISLHAKAKAEPAFRFYTLWDKVCRADVLEEAYRACHRNGGSAGVDRMTFDQITAYGRERWLEELRQELRAGEYRPQPLLRVSIPKSNGSQRPLGIPCIRDRVVEMAALLVLSPIFEADLLRNQYGFRPEMDAKMAVRQAFWHVRDRGHSEVVDADLSDYFSSIPHSPLMRCVSRRIADGTLLSVIKSWLTAPVIERDQRTTRCTTEAKDRHRGTPQGSPITPPTILQKTARSVRGVGAGWVMRWLDAKDDVHVLPVDLNPLHQQTDQLAALLPIRCSETILNSFGKLFEPPDDERQGAPLCGFVTHGIGLCLPSLDPLSKACKPRFELPPFNQTFGVAVDQSVHAAP